MHLDRFIVSLATLAITVLLQVPAAGQDLHSDIEEVDQSFDGPFDGQFEFRIGVGVLQQLFVPSADEISGVDLHVRKFTTGISANVTVRICSLTAPCSSTSALGSATTVLESEGHPNIRTEHFHFDSPIPVVPGASYVLEVTASIGTPFMLLGSDGNPYPGGYAIAGGSSHFISDFGFRTYTPTAFVGFEKFLNDAMDPVTLHVIDPDANLDPVAPDLVYVDVASDTDPVGIMTLLEETSGDSAVFTGSLDLTLTGASSAGVLRVTRGDLLLARYGEESATAAVASPTEDFSFLWSFEIEVPTVGSGDALATDGTSLYWWQRDAGWIYELDPADGAVRGANGAELCGPLACFPAIGSAMTIGVAPSTLRSLFLKTKVCT